MYFYLKKTTLVIHTFWPSLILFHLCELNTSEKKDVIALIKSQMFSKFISAQFHCNSAERMALVRDAAYQA